MFRMKRWSHLHETCRSSSPKDDYHLIALIEEDTAKFLVGKFRPASKGVTTWPLSLEGPGETEIPVKTRVTHTWTKDPWSFTSWHWTGVTHV